MHKPVTSSGRSRKLWSEQNAVAEMQHILGNFIKYGAMVFDPCMEKGASAKAFLMVQQRRKFTACDIDDGCVEKTMPYLLETFSMRILSKDSDKVRNSEAENEAIL